ncbi:hypothetical protein G3O08_09830 [Cryomorpha ignava]|uniref:Uncharacterized protein n=1 Tax=Cryomorpha ignava TaxID=101383 RepID=A0A7K3WQ68_9FLAO|nr:class I lanthipeptide [Cryomorpha ignava]NEN23800.1 hypothetical protein [Cryomorpha ignava]
MKKIELHGRLSLNKETIVTLNDDQMNSLKGGAPGFLSIGSKCTQATEKCRSQDISRPIFCNEHD